MAAFTSSARSRFQVNGPRPSSHLRSWYFTWFQAALAGTQAPGRKRQPRAFSGSTPRSCIGIEP
jgi:hypothetical protein